MKKLLWIICIVIFVMAYLGIVGVLRNAKEWLWGESDGTEYFEPTMELTDTEEGLMISEESDEVIAGDE